MTVVITEQVQAMAKFWTMKENWRVSVIKIGPSTILAPGKFPIGELVFRGVVQFRDVAPWGDRIDVWGAADCESAFLRLYRELMMATERHRTVCPSTSHPPST